MASATVTNEGIRVTFDASEVADDADPVNQDDWKIEVAFAAAIAELGTTTAHVDMVTYPMPWSESKDQFGGSVLVQLFEWLPGVSWENWRTARR